MSKIDEYLKLAVQKHASDVHFASNMPVSLRIDGDLHRVDEQPHTHASLQEMLLEILNNAEIEKFKENKNLDKSHMVPNVGNFRVNILMGHNGIGAVFRWIPEKVPSMEEVGLPPSLQSVMELGKGMVLVTGPTGSGKSTTLASMVDHLNTHKKDHILTVEDPIEFIHPSKKSLVTQREIGNHCASFADALKYALREDPDVILVGEMRDLETISLAMTAAETGHLVFGTLHTRGAAASVDRIIDSFPANQQAMVRAMLAESLRAVISQSLIKRADGQGRVAAFEILIVNHAVSNLIREGKTFQIGTVMQTGRNQGMQLMDHHILELIRSGVIRSEDAEAHVSDPTVLPNRRKPATNYASGGLGGKKKPAPYGRAPGASGAPGKPPAMAPPFSPKPGIGKGPPPMAPKSAPAPTSLPPNPAAAPSSAPAPIGVPGGLPPKTDAMPAPPGGLPPSGNSAPAPGALPPQNPAPAPMPEAPASADPSIPDISLPDAGEEESTSSSHLPPAPMAAPAPVAEEVSEVTGMEELQTGDISLPDIGGNSAPPPPASASGVPEDFPDFGDDIDISGAEADDGGFPVPPPGAEVELGSEEAVLPPASAPPSAPVPEPPSASPPPPASEPPNFAEMPGMDAPSTPPPSPTPPPASAPTADDDNEKTQLADHRMGLPPPPGSLFRKKTG